MGDAKCFWVAFNLVPGIGPASVRRLLDTFGSLERAWHASPHHLRHAGVSGRAVQALVEMRSDLDPAEEEQRVYDSGYGFLTWEDPDYPSRLREVDASPPLLYTWGELVESDRLAVALVGTRRASVYGRSVTEELASTLAASGITIVSGLARGIDAAAHEAALRAGGRTIAVLGSGLTYLYPAEHRQLAGDIAVNGAVVSDYALDVKPEGKNFPPRNRIISGLSLAIVVIEAGENSGALITADFAVEQGRDIFAVPGDITRPGSVGANRLIQSGAEPLLSPDDVLERLNIELIARQEQACHALPDDATERQLLQLLSDQPLHVDEIGVETGIPAADVAAKLALLELKGRVRQVGGMHYIRMREPKTPYHVE